MSKGKIIKPENPERPQDSLKKQIVDTIYEVVQKCEVDVEDKLYEELKDYINQKAEELDSRLNSINEELKDKIAKISKLIGTNKGDLSSQIKQLTAELSQLRDKEPLKIIVKTNTNKSVDLGFQHIQFPTLLRILESNLNVFLVGPSGSGKTHAATQCAKALEIPFYFTGAVASEFKLTGFIDAKGQIVSTEFRKAYENGGLFLFDEIDASYPQAVLAFNAALSNDFMDFPDKRVERHKDFYCIAAANTYGHGADRQYVGRNQLDAASLDRFVFLDWKYDENLERALAKNDEWVDIVQKIRKYVDENKIRHVVSPRSSIFGTQLLSHGIDIEEVKKLVLWKGLDQATIDKLRRELLPTQTIKSPRKGKITSVVKVGDTVKRGTKIGYLTLETGHRSSYSGFIHDTKDIKATKAGLIKNFISDMEVKKGDLLAEIIIE